MTNIKSYTDIKQSKKLAEILPLESADMYYIPSAEDEYGETLYTAEYKSEIIAHNESECIPCWSLAALLDNIPQIKLDNAKHYDKKYWRCCAYYASDWHTSKWYYNPIDACVEMIVKLHHDWFKSFTHQKTTETKGGEIYE